MFSILPDGYARITGRDGVYRVPDMTARAEKRAARAVDPHPLAELSQTWGVPTVAHRLMETLARDTVYMRERMEDQHKKLIKNLRDDRIDSRLPIALHWISGVKPERVRKVTEEHATPVLTGLRRCLGDAVDAHLADRVSVARRMLRDAIAPEVPADAAQAVALGLRAMEVRTRVMAMTELDRLRLVDQLGRQGNLDALAWIGDDPLCVAACPSEVMRNALRNALDARGGGWLVAAVDDAEDEAETLAVTADLIYGGVAQALHDAGAPSDMIPAGDNYQSRVAEAINK